jgi:hypothetical protein
MIKAPVPHRILREARLISGQLVAGDDDGERQSAIGISSSKFGWQRSAHG